MKLTVLGKYGPFPAPGGACSGYLLEADDVSLVLDMGNGTLGRLFERKPTLDISAILLSHLHSDHMADMLVLRYALQQFAARGRETPVPLTVVAPDMPELEYRQLAASGVYDILPAQDGMKIRFSGVSITLHRMLHPAPSFAMVIEHGGRKLVYTGDTGYREDLVRLCADADLLLADTGFLRHDVISSPAAHLTTLQVANIAKRAHVKQLLCTHIWGGGYTDEDVLAEVTPIFPNALVAEELHEYYV